MLAVQTIRKRPNDMQQRTVRLHERDCLSSEDGRAALENKQMNWLLPPTDLHYMQPRQCKCKAP